jgi:hypothetical protein
VSRVNFTLTSYEGTILWRFFDSVSNAVATRMLRGSTPGEENLTFLLCELLDEGATGLHVLDYPLSQVREELARSDAGIAIDFGFETHEHARHFESRYSGADLGIIVTIDHPIIGYSRRAFLVQAKRLFYRRGGAREFSLYSSYESFDEAQADLLRELARRFDAYNSVFYLWYNPPSSGFTEADAKIIRAYESQGYIAPYWGRKQHIFMDELMDMGFPLPFGGFASGHQTSDDEDRARDWRARQPALRVSDLDAVFSVTNTGARPALKPLYDSRLERSHRMSFSPFADFFLLALANSRLGSSNDEWLRLAEGRKVSTPSSKQSEHISPLDELESPPIPRHTITISIRSTLPQLG